MKVPERTQSLFFKALPLPKEAAAHESILMDFCKLMHFQPGRLFYPDAQEDLCEFHQVLRVETHWIKFLDYPLKSSWFCRLCCHPAQLLTGQQHCGCTGYVHVFFNSLWGSEAGWSCSVRKRFVKPWFFSGFSSTWTHTGASVQGFGFQVNIHFLSGPQIWSRTTRVRAGFNPFLQQLVEDASAKLFPPDWNQILI